MSFLMFLNYESLLANQLSHLIHCLTSFLTNVIQINYRISELNENAGYVSLNAILVQKRLLVQSFRYYKSMDVIIFM